LWAKPGVRAWDEHKQEPFDQWALLFVTINDEHKWTMVFPCDEKGNFLLQHHKQSQDAHVCTVWAYYHKLCLDSSHNIAHLS
jgi:hypothetical protein